MCLSLFLFTATSTPEIYILSLHDALPISGACFAGPPHSGSGQSGCLSAERPSQESLFPSPRAGADLSGCRSEEHTSELQSRVDLVCRLLLEKKKKDGYGQ